MKELLKIKDLSLSLGDKKILNSINLTLWEGYIHALVGPNGAGKSTLSSTIMGLPGYKDYSGDILFEENNIRYLTVNERARLGITYGWQEPARFEGITVRQYLNASAKEKSIAAIRKALTTVGLDPATTINRKVDTTLSGGERKKVEIASILLMAPKLVLFDEPDSGIDLASLNKIFEVIRFLKKEGTTIILITHSTAVLRESDHAFLMCHGEIIEKAPSEKIIPYFENNCIPCPHKNHPEEKERS